MATPGPSGTRRGWAFDRTNGRLVAVYNDTEIFDFDGNDLTVTQATTFSGATTLTGAQTLTGVTTHSDEVRIANGKNLRIGTISAFATTEPTNAIVMKTGTAFAGAITTSGGIQSTDTVLTKIIAAGTVSNIET
jgi:hypothetical protein